VLPPHVFDCGRVVTVVDGEASIAVGAAPMQRMQASSPVTVPAGAPHELVCGNDQSCLVLVRADGPLHVTWLDSRDVENPHNMRAARDTH
jgi:quercetin dioxygenase-like cupin family protein